MSSLYTHIVKVRSNMHVAVDKCMSLTLKFHTVFQNTRCHIDIKRRNSKRKSTYGHQYLRICSTTRTPTEFLFFSLGFEYLNFQKGAEWAWLQLTIDLIRRSVNNRRRERSHTSLAVCSLLRESMGANFFRI